MDIPEAVSSLWTERCRIEVRVTSGQNSRQNDGWTETAVRMTDRQNSGQNYGWTETAVTENEGWTETAVRMTGGQRRRQNGFSVLQALYFSSIVYLYKK